jgi:hypothetical protein
MKVVRNILIGLLALVVLIGAGAYFLAPKSVTVEQSVEIDRPASLIYTVLAGAKTFNALVGAPDEAGKAAYEGPEFGVGAKTVLPDGGAREIIDAKPYEALTLALSTAQNSAKVTIAIGKGEGAASKVSWTEVTELGANPIARLAGQFRKGQMTRDAAALLQALKTGVEKLPDVDVSGVSGDMAEAAGGVFVFVAGETAQDAQLVEAAVRGAMKLAAAVLTINRIEPSGPGLVVTSDSGNGQLSFRAGFSIAAKPAEPLRAGEDVAFADAPKGEAMKVAYEGPVDGLAQFRQKAAAYVAARGVVVAGAPWDAYPYGPSMPGAPLKVDIYFPVTTAAAPPPATGGPAPADAAPGPAEAPAPDPAVAAPVPAPPPAPATDAPVDLTSPPRTEPSQQ